MYYTYVLISSLDKSIFYVGKGKGNRMFKHIEIANSKSNARLKNPKLYNKISSILSNGGYIISEVIFESLLENECFKMEINKILEIGLENLTNLTIGGEGTSGYKLSKETRELMSDAKKKYWKNRKDRKVSEETREKISKSSKGRKGAWKGKKLSDETRLKMSLAKKGKPGHTQTIETRKKISNTMKNNTILKDL